MQPELLPAIVPRGDGRTLLAGVARPEDEEERRREDEQEAEVEEVAETQERIDVVPDGRGGVG